MPIVAVRVVSRLSELAPCKNLQGVPKQTSTIDLEQQRRGRADPDCAGRLRCAEVGAGLSRRRPRARVPSTPPTPSLRSVVDGSPPSGTPSRPGYGHDLRYALVERSVDLV